MESVSSPRIAPEWSKNGEKIDFQNSAIFGEFRSVSPWNEHNGN